VADLALTFFPGKCREAGCNRPAGAFSVCKEHQSVEVNRQFIALVKSRQAHPDALPCFNSTDEYREYVVAYKLAQPNGVGSQFKVDPCRDCDPKYRDRMIAAGRCQHPETVFIRSNRFAGDRIGVALLEDKKHSAWEAAVMGLSGPVVSLPQPEVIDQTVARLSVKKKMGRPKKGEQR